ncbi:putative ATP11 protein [Seiridium cardinale]|uniref:ATP11 protein n=1 Tax=Seiridium cardinale TaxID=138064 RepID=A0ABR2XIR4_9PEZI
MVAYRVPAMRSLLGRQLQNLRGSPQQRRWAQVHDVRFLATTQPSRNIAEKYREKLDRKAKEEGLPGIGALKAAYAEKIQQQRKQGKISVPGLDALLADEEAPTQAPTAVPETQPEGPPGASASPNPPKQPISKPASTKSGIKPLSEILDLPKARDLPVKELSAIWRLRHASNPTSLCAVVSASTYSHLEATAKQHSTFVLPVPREGAGAEIHFLQWVFDRESQTSTALFTQLAEYKARGEWAQPHTSITHYFDKEVADNQGVVLMAGNVVDGRGASVKDAQWLVMLMQRFYGAEALAGTGEKRRLLEEFGKGAAGGFSVEKLLEESEKLG